jgi:FkbM family methyltransferase
MPEYLKNKIEKLRDFANIWVLEKSREPIYNTVRLRIEKIIGDERIITWEHDPINLFLNLISEINPDVIHFEEPCEQFIDDFLLENIYKPERSYKIFETLHDSSIRPEEKRYLPDKFIVVSPWQVGLLDELGVPMEVIEHELTEKNLPSKEECMSILGLDPRKKHVLQVGIFTPRKNQIETFNIARFLPGVEFHFIGTLAENYKWHWEHILLKKPGNCRIWGERDDVDLFYKACDLVIFPSISLFNDKETSPLVIREAINMGSPLLLRDLPVYVGMYQESDRVTFMKSTNEENANLIKNILDMDSTPIIESNIDIKFNSENNEVSFEFLTNDLIGNLWISIKDIDSNACIYGFPIQLEGTWQSFWCIPIPKEFYDFSGNKNFTGFKLEAYRQRADLEPVASGELIIKERIHKKKLPSNQYINFDPVFVNYSQFFVDGIYNLFFAGQRMETVIDIGANVGLFTEWALDRFGTDTVVIGVEPNESAANAFNEMHKKRPNVHLVKLAVSNKSGEIMEMMVNPENTLISSLEGTGNGYSEKQTVVTITLMDIVKGYCPNGADLLKVDIEGAEYQMLSVVNSGDLRKFRNLLIEFHNNNGRVPDLINKIKNAGFEVDIRGDDTRYSTNEHNDRGTIFATRID